MILGSYIYSHINITNLCWTILYELYFKHCCQTIETELDSRTYCRINGKPAAFKGFVNIVGPRCQDLYCGKSTLLLHPLEGIWQLNHNICNNIIETLKNDFSIHEQPREPRVPRREVSFEGSMFTYLSLKLKN